MADRPKGQEAFGAVLTRLLKFGCRPRLTPQRPGTPWGYSDFAKAVGVAEKSIYNWRHGKTLPSERQLSEIEQALFGEVDEKKADVWAAERRKLRDAFADSVTWRDHRPARTEAAGLPLGRPIDNVSIQVPLHFTGREFELERIADTLSLSSPAALSTQRANIVTLAGMRGVGKTVLAAAFARANSERYHAIWWVRAEQADIARAEFAELGRRLGWVQEQEALDAAVQSTMAGLQRQGSGVLLILDNVPDRESARELLPHQGGCHVLVTSVSSAWGGVARVLEVRVWPPHQGAEFLLARVPHESSRAEAEALSQELGGLPLAHEMAGALCEDLSLSFAAYRRRFAEAPVQTLDAARAATPEYHDRLTVAKALTLAIERAETLHPAAEKLLVALALVPPEPVPRYVLEEGRHKLADGLAELLAGDGLDEALAALRRVALVEPEAVADERDPAVVTDCWRLHRLVRAVAAARRDAAAAQAVRGGLLWALATAFPNDCYANPASWLRARRLEPVVLPLLPADAALPPGAEQAAAYLLDVVAQYRQGALGACALVRPFYERALAVRQQVFGPDHPQTVVGLSNLAGCLLTLGDAAAARQMFEQALEASQRVLGPEHPETLTNLANLAGSLWALGDAAGARELDERALAARERVRGPDHPETLASRVNLAGSLWALGDAAGARALYESALPVSERVRGPEHPDTLTTLNNLAACLFELGDAMGAVELLRRAVAGRERVLGPEHPRTQAVRANLEQAERLAGKID